MVKEVMNDLWLARISSLSNVHDKYVIIPADKASNNIVFVCKSYYFECLIKELGIDSNTSMEISDTDDTQVQIKAPCLQ
jgi:hypothetical protein